MKTKLHFGILLILLAFFGRYLEQSSVPNQQIVIQFSNKNIEKDAANQTIKIVKQQLQSIGVEHIQIIHSDNNQLKITYYSDSDVNKIQKLLSKEKGFKIAYQLEHEQSDNFPEHRNENDYQLNISEIQDSNTTNWDFERTEVVELNQKSEPSLNPNHNSFAELFSKDQNNSKIKLAIKINNSIAITVDNLTYKIPEVRAGPTA